MFSLIITIISIALVAALALATLYYGGTAFNRGSAGAEAARLINEGQQVNGALAIYKADLAANAVVGTVTDIESLSPAYLSQLPASFSASKDVLVEGLTVVETTVTSTEVCSEINKRAGHTTAPTAADKGVYGCYTSGTPAVSKFYYKV